MKTGFKVYKRKIHVYREANALDQACGADTLKRDSTRWVYAWSTNAYKTCFEATLAAVADKSGVRFISFFAKD